MASRFTEAEQAAMSRAVELSALGEATTKPNPNVGAVVLDASGQVAGEGWHRKAGEPHAEIHALTAAGRRASGGTLLVTLEPCNHQGRTPACTKTIIESGVRRVVYAVADPNPLAAGGAGTLRAAGVDVDFDLLAPEAERANERWLTVVRLGRPYVVWKYAATLDGRVAAADGTSRWITGPEARADVHLLRAACDVIMVGVGTVLTDDPQLTARAPDGGLNTVQPLRVVVDSHGRTPATARVRDRAAPTWIATADDVGRGADERVDLVKLLQRLSDDDRQFVLLEGGPALAGSFLRAGLVDRVVAYLAPALLGAGAAALGGIGVTTIAAAIRLDVDDVQRIGPDLRVSARVPQREV